MLTVKSFSFSCLIAPAPQHLHSKAKAKKQSEASCVCNGAGCGGSEVHQMFKPSTAFASLDSSRHLQRLKDMCLSRMATVNQESCPKIKSDAYVQAIYPRNFAPQLLHGRSQDICILCSESNATNNIPICWHYQTFRLNEPLFSLGCHFFLESETIKHPNPNEAKREGKIYRKWCPEQIKPLIA